MKTCRYGLWHAMHLCMVAHCTSSLKQPLHVLHSPRYTSTAYKCLLYLVQVLRAQVQELHLQLHERDTTVGGLEAQVQSLKQQLTEEAFKVQ